MRIDCVNNNGLCKIDGDRIAVGTDGGLVIVNITKGEIEGRYNDIKILRMNNYYYYINKLGIKKIYTKEIIDKVFDGLKW